MSLSLPFLIPSVQVADGGEGGDGGDGGDGGGDAGGEPPLPLCFLCFLCFLASDSVKPSTPTVAPSNPTTAPRRDRVLASCRNSLSNWVPSITFLHTRFMTTDLNRVWRTLSLIGRGNFPPLLRRIFVREPFDLVATLN